MKIYRSWKPVKCGRARAVDDEVGEASGRKDLAMQMLKLKRRLRSMSMQTVSASVVLYVIHMFNIKIDVESLDNLQKFPMSETYV